MSITHAIHSLIVGLVVGLIARAVLPGADHMGLIATALLGVVGSFVGGFVGGIVSRPAEGASFHPAGLLLSVIGAILVLLGWRAIG